MDTLLPALPLINCSSIIQGSGGQFQRDLAEVWICLSGQGEQWSGLGQVFGLESWSLTLDGLVGVRLSGMVSPATKDTGLEDEVERYKRQSLTSGREEAGLDGPEMGLSWCEEPGIGLGWARMSSGEASVGSRAGLGYLE